MKRNWRAVCPIAAIVVIGACAPKVEWRDYSYPKQGFAAAYPTTPKVSDKPGTFVADDIVGTDDYTVTVTCDPSTDETAEDLLAAGIGLWTDQGTIKSQTNVTSGQTVWRELLVDNEGAPSARVRVFAHHQCLYQVVAVVKKGPTDPTVTHFMSSFRLL